MYFTKQMFTIKETHSEIEKKHMSQVVGGLLLHIQRCIPCAVWWQKHTFICQVSHFQNRVQHKTSV